MGFGSFVSGAGESLTCFSLYRRVARDRPSHYGKIGDTRITVGRGPVPRQASKPPNTREGQARALRIGERASLYTVGRGPVPRQASGSSNDCEGQALALRKNRNGLSRGTGPRTTENRNGLLARDSPSHYGKIGTDSRVRACVFAFFY